MTTPGPRPASGHAAFEELAVGYALSALEPDEDLRFSAHVSGCWACQRAVAEHEALLADVALTAPQVEPPASLLEGIRAAVAAEPRPGAAVRTPVASLGDRRRRREVLVVRRSWVLSAAAGVTAVVLALGTWSAVLLTDRQEQTARGDRLAQAVAALEDRDARAVRLADYDGDVRAVVVASDSTMSLVVDGLTPNDPETVYVLWGQTRDWEVRALGTFDVRRGGVDVHDDMPLEVPVGELTTFMVTHEKGRTPPAQTSQPVLVAGSV